MARKRQPTAEEYVRKVFQNAEQKVIFTQNSKKERELKDALEELGISYTVADMPYESSVGGVTYKHTLIVKDKAALTAILNEKEIG